MIKPGLHAKTALVYFILAAVLGLLLRSFKFLEVGLNYKFIIHTHSHIALLGWVYLAVTTVLYKLYLNKLDLDDSYSRIFWFTQLTLVGMLFTFPIMGYALFSIIFSTLFLFASYWFTWFFLSNVPPDLKKTHSFICIRLALWYLVISSLGPWALGGIMNTLGPETVWYRLAIYFYLHFLYNGWMILSLIGLLLFILEKLLISLPHRTIRLFLLTFNLGVICSFFLSTLFADPPLIFYFLGGLGAIIQLLAFVILGIFIWNLFRKDQHLMTRSQFRMLKTIGLLVFLKMALQIISAHPYFAQLAAVILDFTIGYLHLTFLGVVTIGLFLFLNYSGLLNIPKRGYYLYLIGFIISEALIFYRAIAAWIKFRLFNGHSEFLAAASFLMVIALIHILIANYRHAKAASADT